jgi:HSP20 family protein
MTGRSQHPVDQFRGQFDRLFDRFFGGWPMPFEQEMGEMRMWDFNVKEDDKEITVRAEVPGFDENELDVQLHNDVLTIKAEKEQKGDGSEEYRSFYRSLTLPGGIDAEKVQASYRNGVLELHIPRAEGTRPRRITIQGQEAGKAQEGMKEQRAAEGRKAEPQSNGGKKSAGQTAKT